MKVLGNNIIFKFLDDTSIRGFSGSKTDWGFMIQDPPSEVKVPRWGLVVATGPDVREVSAGEFVLIEPLMWTNKIKVGDEYVWKTDINKVMLTSKDRPKNTV